MVAGGRCILLKKMEIFGIYQKMFSINRRLLGNLDLKKMIIKLAALFRLVSLPQNKFISCQNHNIFRPTRNTVTKPCSAIRNKLNELGRTDASGGEIVLH